MRRYRITVEMQPGGPGTNYRKIHQSVWLAVNKAHALRSAMTKAEKQIYGPSGRATNVVT